MESTHLNKKLQCRFKESKFYWLDILKIYHGGLYLKTWFGFRFFCERKGIKKIKGEQALLMGRVINACCDRQAFGYAKYKERQNYKEMERKVGSLSSPASNN